MDRKAVVVEDLATDSRWPKYRADALEETPVRSVLSLPLFADELSMGALNFYAERAGGFSSLPACCRHARHGRRPGME